MRIADIIAELELWAPPVLQENYDNAGLIIGDSEADCHAVLCCLDVTDAVLDEAITVGANLIVAHHPIVFAGLKKLTGRNYVERIVIRAIREGIAIYASHTNLDNIQQGVNGRIAERLGLKNTRVLAPKPQTLRKLFTFVPVSSAGKLRQALFNAGAGEIGAYSSCSFNTEGIGTFLAGPGTDPYVGKQGELHSEAEIKMEMVFPAHLEALILKTLFNNHPYEEVAFDIVALANPHPQIGAGLVGDLPEPLEATAFLGLLQRQFCLRSIRHTAAPSRPISRVALCGGAGSFLISKALSVGADAFVTADLKYHEFFDAGGRLLLADIGHYESEQFTIDLIREFLLQKFPTFAVLKTKVETNPVQYFVAGSH